MGRPHPDTTVAILKSVYLNPKSNVRVEYSQKSASILPSVSFDHRSFAENLFLSKLLHILLHYSIILIWWKTVSTETWTEEGEKRV